MRMRDGARIVNCARGGLLDEVATAHALDAGKLAGVALDVFENEPPAVDNPLFGRKDVLTTPHLGAYSHEAQSKVAGELAQVFTDFLKHKKPTNLINPSAVSM